MVKTFIEVIIIITSVIVVIAALFYWLNANLSRPNRGRIYKKAMKTGRAIDADHHAAKRAMNEAAGQSWRNLPD